MIRRTWHLLLLLAALLGGCGTVEHLLDPNPRTLLRQLVVVADVRANQPSTSGPDGPGSATALDIVFVHDPNVLSVLPKSGPEWFDKKQALQDELGNAIEVIALGVPPGKVYEVPMSSHQHEAIAVYSYAYYLPPDVSGMGTLTRFKCAQIRLGPRSIAYRDDPCP